MNSLGVLAKRNFAPPCLIIEVAACAVTSIAVPEVLRASHAKPWAECANDAERLDVFNGFLLTANLDALFDRFLINFDDVGKMLVSPRLTAHDLATLGLSANMRPRWLTDVHRHYLAFQRQRFVNGGVMLSVHTPCQASTRGPI
jgi:predicted restriction endonuclease